MTVIPIPLSHPNQGYGYKFTENGKDFVFLTDNELAFPHDGGRTYSEYVNFCGGADFLIHDAEFTEKEYRRSRSWGHSVYTDALRLALEAKVKKIGLFHHNQERTDAALEGIVENCRKIIGEHGEKMECFALSQQTEIQL